MGKTNKYSNASLLAGETVLDNETDVLTDAEIDAELSEFEFETDAENDVEPADENEPADEQEGDEAGSSDDENGDENGDDENKVEPEPAVVLDDAGRLAIWDAQVATLTDDNEDSSPSVEIVVEAFKSAKKPHELLNEALRLSMAATDWSDPIKAALRGAGVNDLCNAVKAMLPTTGASTKVVDPKDEARGAAERAVRIMKLLMQSFDKANDRFMAAAEILGHADEAALDAYRIELGQVASMPNEKLDKAFGAISTFLEKGTARATGTRSSSGSASADRKSTESDYVEGASFIKTFKDGRVATLVIENGEWLVNGVALEKANQSASGAAKAASGNSENGYRFWSVASNA
jgi:hypothetical protein